MNESIQARVRIRVQQEDFDPAREILTLESQTAGRAGAVVSFTGLARERTREEGQEAFPVERITLEHYPGMTEHSLQEIAERAVGRWELESALVIHRYGELRPGDRIVLVAAASAHRDAAFEACRYMVDTLKTEAPFWKRESGPRGTRWVEAKASDSQARERWETPKEIGRSRP